GSLASGSKLEETRVLQSAEHFAQFDSRRKTPDSHSGGKECEDVLLNKVAVDRLIKAAQLTTVDNPLIPVADEDRWFFLNAILNDLSETFATGLFRREAGKPVDAIHYLICLTNECDGDIRTRKVRAMVIRKETLINFPKEPPALERPHHAIRLKTLQKMQKAYATDPGHFIEVEIVV
ncbi:MAG TPA: hypothetical protein PLR25_09505, partial [Planctomycetaceae bacterium]|nr:hypothetical protein [Planctomycetaceae bacterium]